MVSDVDVRRELHCDLPEIIFPVAKVCRVDNDLEMSTLMKLVCSAGLDHVHEFPHIILALDLELLHSLANIRLRGFVFHGAKLLQAVVRWC